VKNLFNFLKKNDKKILIVSLQKSGTHLIQNIMKEAGYIGVGVGKDCSMNDFNKLKKNQYLWSHFPPSDQVQMELEQGKEPLHIIFNYRDPRDVLVSWFHWLHPSSSNNMHEHMAYMKKVYSHFSDDQLIDIFINNDKFRESEYNPIEAFRLARVLYFHPKVLNISFEDLIGENGGGSNDLQIKAIEKIFNYLNIPVSNIESISARAFNKNSATFRKGVIGDYKSILNSEKIKLFNDCHGDILKQYGYKKDD